MPPSNPRSINPLLTIEEQNNVRRSIAKAETELQNDVRQSIAKAEAELQRLLDHREKVTNNISQLKDMLAIHRILPREIIGYIFSILCAEKVSIPHKQGMTPPQITISHVCSEWREIALATPTLWNNVELTQPGYNEWVQVAIELLFNRGGTQGVTLELNMGKLCSYEMVDVFYDVVLPLHVKKLHLTLPLSALEKLSKKSEDIIANIDEIALSFTISSKLVPFASDSKKVSITPQFLSKIRSVTSLDLTCRYTLAERLDLQSLSWGQMRHLCWNTPLTLSVISDILRQTPLLDVCGICVINVKQDDEVEPTTVVTLPQLRIFHIVYRPQSDQDRVLRSFKCPNLTDFRLQLEVGTVRWTSETYKIIENQYNFHRLRRFSTSEFPYPVSKALFDAPMLQELFLDRKIFMDERALQGIASGELGRCLTSLCFVGNFNQKSVLDMVASRQRHVKQAVEASRSWQDQISSIKWIFLCNVGNTKDGALVEELNGKRGELEELGVIVHRSSPVDSHPLSSLGEFPLD